MTSCSPPDSESIRRRSPYVAGLISSGGELAFCVTDPAPRRLGFDLERALRTEYQIDRYQTTYFVIDSFAQLMRDTTPEFTPIYDRLRNLPALAA